MSHAAVVVARVLDQEVGRDGSSAPRTVPRSVAIVHEWLTTLAGSELCVLAIREAFPRHHVYTSILAPTVFPELRDSTTVSPLLGRLTGENAHLPSGPLLPLAMRTLRIHARHDVAIVSFHHFAVWARIPRETLTIVYCHTPPRFLYRGETLVDETRLSIRFARAVAVPIRRLDRRRVRRLSPTMIANSHAVAARIQEVYGLPARVVHPPVATEVFSRSVRSVPDVPRYFLWVGRLVAYKRPQHVVAAFAQLPYELLVVGDGPMRAELERAQPSNVTLLGRVDAAELAALYAGACGLVYPHEEDFGIVPAEAMAAGCPVAACRRGGVTDYLMPGVNGVVISGDEEEAVRAAVRELADTDWDRQAISASVEWLSTARFRANMQQVVADVMTGDLS